MSQQTEMEIELPPQLVELIQSMKEEQNNLRKNKAFSNADELRKFVAMTLMSRLIQAIEMLGVTAVDTRYLGVSNANQLMRMRRWTAEHLRSLGAQVNDGDPFPGIGTTELNEFGQAFFALGSMLQKKLPEDKEMERTFNRVAAAYDKLVMAVMGNQSVPDEMLGSEQEPDEGEEEEEEAEEEEVSAVIADDPTPAPDGATT